MDETRSLALQTLARLVFGQAGHDNAGPTLGARNVNRIQHLFEDEVADAVGSTHRDATRGTRVSGQTCDARATDEVAIAALVDGRKDSIKANGTFEPAQEIVLDQCRGSRR